MRILAIGLDRKLFEDGSQVALRQIKYGELVERLDIVVFSEKDLGLLPKRLSYRVHVYPTGSLSRLLYILDAFRVAIKLGKPDLVTAQDPFESGLAGLMVSKCYGVPLHLQIHTDLMSPYFYAESFLNKIRFFIAKFIIPRAANVRVVSERIKKSLIRSGLVRNEAAVQVLPIYADINKIRESLVTVDLHKKYPQFKFIILMASRLTKEKNIDLAIRAMYEVVKKFPEVGLVIVGDGPEEKNLESRIQEFGLEKKIILEGWSNDLPSYYKTADIFLLTSRYEGYGITVVESLAAGTPVIMADVGCAGEVLIDGRNGLVFPVEDLGALSLALEKYISDSRLRDSLKSGAQQMAWPGVSEMDYLRKYKQGWQACFLRRVQDN